MKTSRLTKVLMVLGMLVVLQADRLRQPLQPPAYALAVLLWGISAWPLMKQYRRPAFLLDLDGQVSKRNFFCFWGGLAILAGCFTGVMVYAV